MKITVIPKTVTTSKRERVAAYIRVSKSLLPGMESLNTQLEYYQKKITSNRKWELAGIYSDSISGTNTNHRPGFKRLMKDCHEGKIDRVLTKSVTRFARNTVDLLSAVRELKELGIPVVFEKDDVDTMTSTGELVLSLLAAFAQEEARSASENNKWIIRKRFEQGIGATYALYGYNWEDKKLKINPEQAPVVKEIFLRYLNGQSPCKIAQSLNKKGIKSFKGGTFKESVIWDMLREEKYTGNSLLQKTFRESYLTKKSVPNKGELPKYYAQNTHPAIISDKLYEAVQKEIAKRCEKGYLANSSISFNPFTGKVKCANCSRSYRRQSTTRNGKTRYMWKCGNRIDHRYQDCKNMSIAETELYRLTQEVLVCDEITKEIVDEKIDKILVHDDMKLTFIMKNGKQIEKYWKFNSQNAKYLEEKYGRSHESNSNSCNT